MVPTEKPKFCDGVFEAIETFPFAPIRKSELVEYAAEVVVATSKSAVDEPYAFCTESFAYGEVEPLIVDRGHAQASPCK